MSTLVRTSENGFNFGMARGGWEEGDRFYMEGDSSTPQAWIVWKNTEL